MAELYWMALTRDVNFSQYGEDETTVAAAGDANWGYRVIWPLLLSSRGTLPIARWLDDIVVVSCWINRVEQRVDLLIKPEPFQSTRKTRLSMDWALRSRHRT